LTPAPFARACAAAAIRMRPCGVPAGFAAFVLGGAARAFVIAAVGFGVTFGVDFLGMAPV
jgi:hypothetical protein